MIIKPSDLTFNSLSGLSPFLGDDDNETLNNILSCQWSFEESEFLGISEEAKDFISKLLLINKRCVSISHSVIFEVFNILVDVKLQNGNLN